MWLVVSTFFPFFELQTNLTIDKLIRIHVCHDGFKICPGGMLGELCEGFGLFHLDVSKQAMASQILSDRTRITFHLVLPKISLQSKLLRWTLDAKLENIHKPRSSGASHKVVGHLLTEAGYTLWYWGYKNPYMAEYEPRNAVVENMGEVVSFSARRGKQPWLG